MNFFLKTIVCFVLFLNIFTVSLGNNTREYCEKLIETSNKEFDRKNYIKALTILAEAKLLLQPEWKDLQMKIFGNTGLIYEKLSDYTTAMDNFFNAYQIALEISDISTQAKMLNNIGVAYNYLGEKEETNKYYTKAYQLAVQQNDSLFIGYYAANLAASLYSIGKVDEIPQYVNITIQMLKDNSKEWRPLGRAKLMQAGYFYKKEQYDDAIEFITYTLDEFSNQEKEYFNGEFLILLSRVYAKKGENTKAIGTAEKSLNNQMSLPVKISAYTLLSVLFEKENMLSSALLYQDSVLWGYDSLMSMNLDDRIVSDQMRLEVFELEKQLAEKEAKQKMERIIFIGIVIFMSILAVVLIFVFRLQSTKNKQKKIIAENKQELAEKQQRITELELEKERNQKKGLEQQLKDQEISALLEQERLNTENKELSSKIVMESNKNNLIEEMIAKLSSLPNQSQNNDLTSIIKQLKTQLEESSQWENFYSYFEKINPAFLTSLKRKHSELTRNDIQYLSYIYLNLDTKEIASLLHISEASCMKKKQRIAEKMGLKTAELHNYLLTLE
jgi:hypothetical protein